MVLTISYQLQHTLSIWKSRPIQSLKVRVVFIPTQKEITYLFGEKLNTMLE